MDGLKTTKNNEPRTVEVPFPGLMRELVNLAGQNPHGANMETYIFWSPLKHDKPMENPPFMRDLRAALVKTGMSEDSAKVYTFHAWRHFFTTYMRNRVDEKLLQKQTGHKTLIMLDHYSDHVLAGDRERIQQAQIESFAGLIPAYTGYIQEKEA
jgi:integrase